MNKINKIRIVFTIQVLIFLIMFLGIFINEWFRGKMFLFVLFIFFLSSLNLLFFVKKERIKGKLKLFLNLSGGSGFLFFLFTILHNLFYAASIFSKDVVLLKILTEILHTIFFLIGIIICPITFLVGLIGSAYLLIKKEFKLNIL